MYLENSNISCGVFELTGFTAKPSQKEFNKHLKECQAGETTWSDKRAAFLIASINHKQKGALKFLRKNGFKQTHRFRKNPNTGNKIAVFVRKV